MKSSILAGVVALSFLGTAMAQASSLLVVTSYDMPNGDGQALGGGSTIGTPPIPIASPTTAQPTACPARI